MSLCTRSGLGLALFSMVSASVLVGCSNKGATQQAKRDTDRVALQIEDLTNQRNAFREELDRVRQAAGIMQKDLATAKSQMEQDKATLARANADLAAANAMMQSLDAQKAELATMKAQLAAERAKMRDSAAPAAGEQQMLTTPSTQPALNK